MSEQERRALYFRLTGKLASSNFRLYEKFCMGFDEGVAAEREACAQVCDERSAYYRAGDDDRLDSRRAIACGACAAAIRARGQS